MAVRAWVYLWSVFLLAAFLVGIALGSLPLTPINWLAFIPILLLATLVQLFEAEAPNRQLLYLHFIFYFAALLLLPPPLFVVVVTVPHLVEWAKVRWLTPESPHLRQWYLQPFNIANHTIAGSVAGVLIAASGAELGTGDTRSILAFGAAALVYVAINHLLVGLALQLARGISLAESRVLTAGSMLPDVIMAGLGCVVAALWMINPAWIVLALSPVVMMYQALMVPQLTVEAQTDAKTGLLNARYFQKAFEREFERAQQGSEPLALIMADLDYLRNINNTYGHLAGDAVIGGIGRLIAANVRESDSAGRFGGEEFAIVLPGADRVAATVVAERIRQAIEGASFTVPGLPAPIRATMSLGIACFPTDAMARTDLHLAADIAVYQAKEQGRNRVVAAADVPDAVASGLPTVAARQPMPAEAVAAPAPTSPAAAPRASAGRKPTVPARATPPAPAGQPSSVHLNRYVGVTIGAGGLVGLIGVLGGEATSLWLVLALALIALLFELLQITFNGRNTISASVGIGVAAAILCGLVGVIAVGGAIALAHALIRRPPLYKFLFNWATHLLAGAALAMAHRAVGALESVPELLRLPLALIVGMPLYFLIDVGLIAVAVSLASGARLRQIWQAEFSWLAPHYMVLGVIGSYMAMAYQLLGALGLAIAIVPLLLARYAQHQYVQHTQESIRELQRVNQELLQANQDARQAHETVSRLNRSLVELNDEVVETLARLFDARDLNAGNHVAQVALYATLIGQELGLEGDRLKHLRWAAFLHDIGKIAIPEALLFKRSRLTADEFAVIKTHPARGAELLEGSPATRHLAEFVRQHHERWDGLGYPEGLAGETISLEARILNLCDSVEAMASDRPYSVGRTPEEVIAEVRKCAGSQFDPTIAAVFLRIVERHGPELLVNTAALQRGWPEVGTVEIAA